MRWIYDKKIYLILFFLIITTAVYGLRITRPITFQLPWTEEQVSDLNYTLQQLFLMQDGRFELDYNTVTKPSANDGELWLYTSGVAKIQYMANDTIHECLGSTYSSTDRIDIDGAGQITLTGAAKVWKNVELNPDNIGIPTANPPAEDEYLGYSFDRFDRATDEQVYYLWHIPTDFAESTNSVRGHYGFFVEKPPAGGGSNEAVVLGFEYKKISDGNIFSLASSSTGLITETIIAGETAYTWHETSTGVCTTTGWTSGDIILFRFYRDADNAADTYDNEAVQANNDVWVGVYHLEYLSDKLGGST